ncbi:permease prefix domain 1-containing protein [Microterricola pindariensis]|uniref:ABC transporter permease n=1 Tax=Microterricola pindariensis TaxID=478010 RepID=A0ABX5ASQ6_9MICO|nr:permease prefix domain 1-containing protein [Microterricola pindariensis]PPL15714.1 hypothetical protein GY24_13850 [Microterricola pindariensis]
MSTPSTGTLSERYIWAASRGIPEKQRAELEPEFRELIADSIEAQRANGLSERDAEHAALVELGDPARLAARYTDRPLHLIGPRYYLDWLRLLKLLLAIVVPIAAAAAGVARLLAGGQVGDVVAAVATTAIGVGVHLCFWVTLVFVLIERQGANRSRPLLEWTPDMLPQLPSGNRRSLGELVPTLVFLAVFAAWIVWQHFNSFFTDAAGDPIPLLSPALWSSWLPYFLALIVLEMGFALWLYLRGRWTLTLALVNLLLNLAFTVPALWLLLTGQLINPAFEAAVPVDGSNVAAVSGAVYPIIAIALVGFALWDAVDGFVRAWRARE